MNKLLGYFVKKDKTTYDIDEADFPQFAKEEEEEIQQHLGLPQNTLNTRSLLMATLKNFSQYDEGENESFMVAGTVRIKDRGEEVIGTVRLKKGEEFGTVKYLGTVRINNIGEEIIDTEDEAPAWADFGTIRIAADDIASGQTQVVSPRSSGGFGYVYRPPEDWELNILSLENGEWGENMSEDAFGKFRKRRAGVQNLFEVDKKSHTLQTSSSKHHHEHHKHSDTHHKSKESKKEKSHHKSGHGGSRSPKGEHADHRSEKTQEKAEKTDKSDKVEKTEKEKQDKEMEGPSAPIDPNLRSWAKWRQQQQ